MIKSSWLCPDCKQSLYVTKSARYWCGSCQAEKETEKVDPLARDFVMVNIEMQIALERALKTLGVA